MDLYKQLLKSRKEPDIPPRLLKRIGLVRNCKSDNYPLTIKISKQHYMYIYTVRPCIHTKIEDRGT